MRCRRDRVGRLAANANFCPDCGPASQLEGTTSDRLIARRRGERGIVAVLLLFAMSAFAVLGIAGLTTGLGAAPSGRTFSILRSVPQGALTQFIAPMVVPNDWRTQGESGSYQFQLPVIVPEMEGDGTGATSAWHALTEVPGMALCCDAGTGVCSRRLVADGGEPIEDWTPGPDDTLRLSFDLTSRPDSDPEKGDVVTATVTPASTSVEGSPIACQLEFDGGVIAKGAAVLRLEPRQESSALATGRVEGTLTLVIRTR